MTLFVKDLFFSKIEFINESHIMKSVSMPSLSASLLLIDTNAKFWVERCVQCWEINFAQIRSLLDLCLAELILYIFTCNSQCSQGWKIVFLFLSYVQMLLSGDLIILLLQMSWLSGFRRKAENIHTFSQMYFFLMHINPLTIYIYWLRTGGGSVSLLLFTLTTNFPLR